MVYKMQFPTFMFKVLVFLPCILFFVGAQAAPGSKGGTVPARKKQGPTSITSRKPIVEFKKEDSPQFLPNRHFLGPQKVQMGHQIFDSYADFMQSPFRVFAQNLPQIDSANSHYLVVKAVSIVKRSSEIFAKDENYTDEKISQLFSSAKPKRIPNTNRFQCDLPTGYNNLTVFGIDEQILFTATFDRYQYPEHSKYIPEIQMFHISPNQGHLPVTLVLQPGQDYSFLMNSSLSAYSFSPCYTEVCKELPADEYTVVTSYQIFAIRNDLPWIMKTGSRIFSPGEGLPGTMVNEMRASIPGLLERFYNLDNPVQTAEIQ